MNEFCFRSTNDKQDIIMRIIEETKQNSDSISEENSDSDKSEKSRETTELINPEDLELSSETESELSEYNLEQLFEEPELNICDLSRYCDVK